MVANIQGDPELLSQVLQYHVVPGALKSGDLTPGALGSLQGNNVAIRTDLDAPRANQGRVVEADIMHDGSVIHGIDSVLVPPALLAAVGMPSLNAAVAGGPISAGPGLSDADVATLDAICAYIGDGGVPADAPPIVYDGGENAESDAERRESVDAHLSACGLGGYKMERLGGPLAADFTG